MKITGLALTPPASAKECPAVTPELLASCLARYSRSNKGIASILENVDPQNPDAAVDAIFKFVDYGHASIGGLTGGIAIAVDNCSMLLAYKLFEIAQLSDGQESSTRYIRMTAESLPSAEELGIPAPLRQQWLDVMTESFALYEQHYAELDANAQARPELVRAPLGAPPKVVARIRKNYALDRARYFIPVATRNNIALIMTARVWAQTIRQLESYPLPEFQVCAEGLRRELEKFTPRLVRHSYKDEASEAQSRFEVDRVRTWIKREGCGIGNIPDLVDISINDSYPEFLKNSRPLEAAFAGKRNRYSLTGEEIRRAQIRVSWNNVAIAELRDLNRHRSGFRFTPLTPVGFYLPPEIPRTSNIEAFLRRYSALVEGLAQSSEAVFYGYLFGTQSAFEHATQLDKMIYEVELRTGLGAHYRYAEHLALVYQKLVASRPELKPFIELGTAEPE